MSDEKSHMPLWSNTILQDIAKAGFTVTLSEKSFFLCQVINSFINLDQDLLKIVKNFVQVQATSKMD